MARFADRRDAGARLAAALEPLRAEHPVVIGLARGGVIVAAEVARALGAPLDVLVARKIGAPGQSEYAIGAIAPGGVALLDEAVVAELDVPRPYLDGVIAEETAEMRRREALYRQGAAPVEVRGRVVVVIDDGLATGFTAAAALRSLRARGPERLVFAAPVCAPSSGRRLAEADEVVCLRTPLMFRAVGEWYEQFEQSSDEEVIAALRDANAHAAR